MPQPGQSRPVRALTTQRGRATPTPPAAAPQQRGRQPAQAAARGARGHAAPPGPAPPGARQAAEQRGRGVERDVPPVEEPPRRGQLRQFVEEADPRGRSAAPERRTGRAAGGPRREHGQQAVLRQVDAADRRGGEQPPGGPGGRASAANARCGHGKAGRECSRRRRGARRRARAPRRRRRPSPPRRSARSTSSPGAGCRAGTGRCRPCTGRGRPSARGSCVGRYPGAGALTTGRTRSGSGALTLRTSMPRRPLPRQVLGAVQVGLRSGFGTLAP